MISLFFKMISERVILRLGFNSRFEEKGVKGVHPDEAATFFGYNSGSEMLTDLMSAPPIKETAEANAESRMIERHGDVFTDGTIERLADEAVMNDDSIYPNDKYHCTHCQKK